MAINTKARALIVKREGVLAEHVRATAGASFNPSTLSRSYDLPFERVMQIIRRNGGSIG